MPRDPTQLAKRIVDLATVDEAERAKIQKNVAAAKRTRTQKT